MKTRSFLRKVFRNSLGFIKLSLFLLCLFHSTVILAGIENLNFVAFDHQGTAKLLVNEDCEVVWPVNGVSEPNQLLPFGAEIHQSQDETIYDLNFTNKELDRDLGLHYFGARFYNAELCRFLSPDLIGGRPEDPLSWNRYLYCLNNPIKYVDPNGKFPFLAVAGIAAGIAYFSESANAPQTPEDVVSSKGPLYTVLAPAIMGTAIEQIGSDIINYFLSPDQDDKNEVLDLRQKYENDVRNLSQRAEQMKAEGISTEQIANALHTKRNELKIKYRKLTPTDKVKIFEQRNIQKYGNPIGPSIENLRSQGKTWEEIIDSATRPGGKDLGF